MDLATKIEILSEDAKFDICGSYFCSSAPRMRGKFGRWIYPSVLPDGKTVTLFKVLLTNECRNNCLYCINTSKRNKIANFKAEELAKVFIELFNKRIAEGLFLSSAIKDSPDFTMKEMIKTCEILRFKYRFKGYLHLKILPGASFDYVKRAAELSNRISINLEAPTEGKLKRIAPEKNFKEDILKRIFWANLVINKENLNTGITTQFVVGASGEKDIEIVRMCELLYKKLNLKRVYFSAFQPQPGTPLEDFPPSSLTREHRLYQVDFLIRKYGFKFEEIVFDRDGNLPENLDPKLAWAFKNPEKFPVEINRADKSELLRVPGIGIISAERIIRERRLNKISSLEELKNFGVVVKRAKNFITINGKIPA
jgi:putative DNA modification/repair radical SAM protein